MGRSQNLYSLYSLHWVKHEMIDDQLTAALEQIEQACLAIGTSKTFIYPDHWHPATLGIHTIAVFRKFLSSARSTFAQRATLLALQLSDALWCCFS